MKILDDQFVVSFDTQGHEKINIQKESGTSFKVVGVVRDTVVALEIFDSKNEK